MNRQQPTDRIEFAEQKIRHIVAIMANGNPGAVACLVDLVQREHDIDPQAWLHSFATIALLDRVGIRGSGIYVLWNDQCGRKTRDLVMLMRAFEFGLISADTLRSVAADQTRSQQIDLDELDKGVCARLSDFQRRPSPNASEA